MEANALEAFHEAHVELQHRTCMALQHVGAMETTVVRKAVLRAEIEMNYQDELELLRAYYEVWE